VRRLGLALVLSLVAAACSCSERVEPSPTPSFQAWDLYLDVQQGPLAAWQADLSSQGEALQIVGVEGGDHPGFHSPPYYDPAALAGGRLVLAAFDTGEGLPAGRHRVATLHLRRVEGPERVDLQLQVAAGPEGAPVPARALLRARSSE